MTDTLSDRNYALSQMTEFPSFAWYAQEWEKLAADMEMDGRTCTAENCRARAKHYYEVFENGGNVIRFVQGGKIKLVELDKPRRFDPPETRGE